MKSRSSLLTMLLLAAVLAGCASSGKKTPTQSEQAKAQWNKTRAAVLASLAKSQYDAGAFDTSRQTVSEALRLDPNSGNLHLLSAKLSIELGQLEQADRDLALTRTLDPRNAEAEYLSGVVYQRWQKLDEAYARYTSAADKNPQELAYPMARAETLVTLNRAPEALQILQSAANRFEHSPILDNEIGQLQVSLGNYHDAVESLREASLLAPEDLTIREHLAMAYYYDRQYAPARGIFARIIKEPANTKRPELWMALGECQSQTGALTDARGSFETAVQISPSSTAAWLGLAKTALQLGDLHRAEIVLRKAMSIDSNSAEANLLLGYVRLRQNKFSEALKAFQKASELDHNDPVSMCMIGYVLEKSGHGQRAMFFYAQALKIKPGDDMATRLIASLDINE